MIGDFNDILYAHEKKDMGGRPQWLMNGFRKAIHEVGLFDINLEGYQFT